MINLLDALMRRSERRRTFSRIREFDDHLLADIGLTRADLDAILGRRPARPGRPHNG